MMMTIIVALLVVLLVAIIIGFILVFNKFKTPIEDAYEEIPMVAISQEDIVLYSVGDQAIVTNLKSDSSGKNHVGKVKVSLGIDYTSKKEGEKIVAVLADKTPTLQDIIIGVLRSKTSEELRTEDVQDVLGDEILEKICEAFSTNLIVDVYFSELLID